MSKLVTARKAHWCEACRWPIYPGEAYHRETLRPWDHPENEGFWELKLCRFCNEHRGMLFPRENDYAWNEEYCWELLDHWLGSDVALAVFPPTEKIDSWCKNGPEWWRIYHVAHEIEQARKAAWASL